MVNFLANAVAPNPRKGIFVRMARIALGLSSVLFISLPTWALASALVSSSSYRAEILLGMWGQRVWATVELMATAAGDGLAERGHDM